MWLCRSCSLKEAAKPENPTEAAYEDRNRPNLIACAISYLTVSRYGDIAVRSTTEGQKDGPGDSHWSSRCWWEAIGILTVGSVGLLVGTGWILALQSEFGVDSFRKRLANILGVSISAFSLLRRSITSIGK